MRTNVVIITVATVLGAVVMAALWGCGTTPPEQPYVWQAWDPPVQDAGINVGQKTEIAAIMKQMRTASLNLGDRLLYGSLEGIFDAAVQINSYADVVTKLQPAIALEGMGEAADWKLRAFTVKDMSIEVIKALDAGKPDAADYYYTRMFQACNGCHHKFRGVVQASVPSRIPEIETPETPPVPEEGDESGPAPVPSPAPAPVE